MLARVFSEVVARQPDPNSYLWAEMFVVAALPVRVQRCIEAGRLAQTPPLSAHDGEEDSAGTR